MPISASSAGAVGSSLHCHSLSLASPSGTFHKATTYFVSFPAHVPGRLEALPPLRSTQQNLDLLTQMVKHGFVGTQMKGLKDFSGTETLHHPTLQWLDSGSPASAWALQ